MDFYAEFALDLDKFENGAKIYFDDGSWIKIRHWSSMHVQEQIRAIDAPFLNDGGIPADQREIVVARKVASAIADWAGMTFKREPLPYTPENAVKIMHEFVQVRELVALRARQYADFRAKDALEMLGNLKKPSNGKSNTSTNEDGSPS